MKNIREIIGSKVFLVFLFIFAVHSGAFFLIKDHGLMMDEWEHYPEILSIIHGKFVPHPNLPMTPGYHFTVGYTARFLGWQDFPWVRLISFTFDLLTIPVFYLVAKKINQKSAIIKTLQYSFFPIFFPFYYILYTDLFSLLVLLIAFFAVLKNRYTLAAVISSLSILVRQNNIFWEIFLFCYIYIKDYGYNFSKANILKHLDKTLAFILGPLIFGLFVIINGGVAVGVNSNKYVFFTLLKPGNIYIISFYFLILFLPLLLVHVKDNLKFLARNKLLAVLVLATFPWLIIGFTKLHTFNLPTATFFMHNAVIAYFNQDLAHRLLLLLITLATVGFTFVIKLQNRAQYLLYPFTVLFLWPLWFMEQRYYTIPFVLFLLFRRDEDKKTELATVVYFMILAFYFYQGIFNWKFFL